MTDNDPPDGIVTRDCPGCGAGLRIRWPPDGREGIELRCYDCREMVEVEL